VTYLFFLLFSSFVAIAFFAGSLILLTLGHRLGARHLARTGETSLNGLGNVEAAIFALVGLLLAFTISGALQRFDERKQLMLKEANTISTAYSRLGLLDDEAKLDLKQKVKAYFGARINLYSEGIDFSLLEGAEITSRMHTARVDKLKSEILDRAVATCKTPDIRTACSMVLPPLNEMLEAARLRDGANRRHPPHAIYIALFVLGLGSSFLAGVSMAPGKRKSWVHVVAFAAALALALFLITDVEYPRLGLVRVNQFDQLLFDLYQSM